jgi:UDP-glucose 4-epimerase
LQAAGRLTGKTAQVERLTGSLRVDSAHIRDVLGWRPSYSLEAGLAATAACFLQQRAAEGR